VSERLAPGGALAAAIPHFEDRPEQRRMATAVTAAITDNRPLLVEAGTGTGKTLAYLLPALESGQRVVVSTGTRALQDQIVRHDLPVLRQIMGRPFAAATVKGVSNYLCRRKLDEARRQAGRPSRELAAVLAWADDTEHGDRAELELLGESAPVWADVTTTPDRRLGAALSVLRAVLRHPGPPTAAEADLILVNHHLYFADLALRAVHPGARVLPDHDVVIFDEAHQLEDVATEHFGLPGRRPRRLARWPATARMIGASLFSAGHDSAIGELERSAATFFAEARKALVAAGAGGTRVPLPPELLAGGKRREAWFALDGALEELARACEAEALPPPPGEHDEDELATARREQVAAIARRARLVARRSRRAGRAAPARARVLGRDPARRDGAVGRADLGGGAGAPAHRARRADGGVHVGDAGHRGRLRLHADSGSGSTATTVDELAVASPFDYARQAILYVPHDLPHAERATACRPRSRRARGRAVRDHRRPRVLPVHQPPRARAGAARMLTGLPYPLLRQGDAPRPALVERFRATPGAVLLGTGSFWEGVDVPGDALSLVVIDKLPFAPHTDPLTAARAQAIAARGGDPFAELSVPQAAIALKQGFGPLDPTARRPRRGGDPRPADRRQGLRPPAPRRAAGRAAADRRPRAGPAVVARRAGGRSGRRGCAGREAVVGDDEGRASLGEERAEGRGQAGRDGRGAEQIDERRQREGPLGQARVRDDEARGGDGAIAPDQQVQVEGAGAPATLARAIATGPGLEAVEGSEHAVGRPWSARRDGERGVQVVGLAGGQGGRAVDPRGRHGAVTRPPRGDRGEAAQARGVVAEVGPEADRERRGRGRRGHGAAITGLARTPIPSTSTSTRSPGSRLPTPAGVPVEIRSPGSSVR
jgi:ATP-dependent DNA helicase DinG